MAPLSAFLGLLDAVVMPVAEGLQLSKPEKIAIAAMPHDVISVARRANDPFGLAHTTKRLDCQLMLGALSPALRSIPSAPLRLLASAPFIFGVCVRMR